MRIYETYGGRKIDGCAVYGCLRIASDLFIRMQLFDGLIIRYYSIRTDLWEATESFHTERSAHETV